MPNSLTCREVLKLRNPPLFRLPASLPPSLPAVRPTSGGRIGPIFSHNTEYRLANTSVVPIKIYPLRPVESFHPSLLAFLFDW